MNGRIKGSTSLQIRAPCKSVVSRLDPYDLLLRPRSQSRANFIVFDRWVTANQAQLHPIAKPMASSRVSLPNGIAVGSLQVCRDIRECSLWREERLAALPLCAGAVSAQRRRQAH